MPSAGDQVSHYRIIGRFGGGGMGVERAYNECAPLLVTLGAPHFDGVRAHPRFQAVLRRMHVGGEA